MATISRFHPFFKKKPALTLQGDNDTVSSDGSYQMSVDSQGRPVRVFSSSNEPPITISAKLGTLSGVFLPCVQSIMGIILFLRLTNITGQAGCIYTSLIILTCTASTLLTSLSLSAIATNGTIQAGGPYYVISRTLGIEIGATIGILFYVGTTLAGTMYVLGAVEALQRTISYHFDARWAALILMWLVASVVSVGVRYVNMASNFFFFMVVVSVFSMCLGAVLFGAGVWDGLLSANDRAFVENLWPHYQQDPESGLIPTFWGLLAIFYPSVTGILAGSNRSAVLETPGKSIPKGTLSAIGVTTFIYLLVVWLFGSVLSNAALIQDKFVVAAVAWPFEKIVASGVIFSSIGAALQSIAGAPLVLVAIAQDDVLPFLQCIKPATPEEGPTRAIWFTWLLASVPALAGNLDYITPVVTMFFLLMYSGINLSCFLLGFLKSPGFRPTFRFFHWSTSLLGFAWCLAIVVLVSPWYYCVSVMGVILMLYLYTKKQQARKDWGDVGNALRYAVATTSLSALSGSKMKDFHAKNWRPQLLTVVDTDDRGSPINLHVLALAKQLKHGGGGIHMVTSVLRTPKGLERFGTCDLMAYSKLLLEHHMKDQGMQDCFAQVVATTSTRSQALWSAVVHSGLGPLSPNTVLLSYPTTRGTPEELGDYLLTVQGIMNLKKAVIIFKGTAQYPPRVNEFAISPPQQTIDLWWVVHDGGLLLLLPYILSHDEAFEKNTKIRLFAVTSSATENPDRLRLAVIDHLKNVRIRATVVVVDLSDTSIADDMRESDESVRLSSRDLTEKSTHHLTVGEVFSQESYEVPYHSVWEDIMETGTASCHGPEAPIADVAFSSGAPTPNGHNNEDRMRTARAFNQALKKYSSRAALVVTNMPLVIPDEPGEEFFDYVDALCATMDNMMLVRGSGIEVVTTYA